MKPKVILWSESGGVEEFVYETEQEARENFDRLKAHFQAKTDGIRRYLFLALENWGSDEEDA